MKLLDSAGSVIQANSTGVIDIGGECTWSRDWKTATLSLSANIDSVSGVYVEHGGVSGEYWAGHYGPSMRGTSFTYS